MTSSDTSPNSRWRTLLTATCWLLAAVMLALVGMGMNGYSLVVEFAVFLAFVAVVILGIGKGALALAGMGEREAGLLLGPIAFGWIIASAVAVAAVYVGPAWAPFALLVVLGVGGWVYALLTHGVRQPGFAGRAWERLRSLDFAAEVLLGAAALRVFMFAEGSRFIAVRGAAERALVQYPDMGFHLAVIKEGLYRGLPLEGYPLMAGFSRLSYHPAFDTLLTTVLRGLRFPDNEAYFALLLPFTYAVFAFGMFTAARAWLGKVRAGTVALVLVALCLSAWILLSKGQIKEIGYLGYVPLRWFIRNPPGSMGGAAALLLFAVLAPGRPLTLKRVLFGALLAGACIAVKAQIALAVGPAFVLALLVEAKAGRIRWKDFLIGSGTAALAAGLAYLTTRGAGGPPSIEIGAFAASLPNATSTRLDGGITARLARRVSSPAESWGFWLYYLIAGLTGWRLLAAAVLAPLALKSNRNPFHGVTRMWVYSGGLVAMVFVVCATLVQREAFVFLPWNIAGHTVKLMWPLGIVWGAVVIDGAIARFVPGDLPKQLRAAAYVLLVGTLVAATIAGTRAIPSARKAKRDQVPLGTVQIIKELEKRTGPYAVVAQNFSTESQAWVSGYGGRRAYAERTASPELGRGQTEQRKNLLAELYSTPVPLVATQLLETGNIDYVIITSEQDAAGLKAATRLVVEYDGNELRQAPNSADRPGR